MTTTQKLFYYKHFILGFYQGLNCLKWQFVAEVGITELPNSNPVSTPILVKIHNSYSFGFYIHQKTRMSKMAKLKDPKP